jgi:hypothetical protein
MNSAPKSPRIKKNLSFADLPVEKSFVSDRSTELGALKKVNNGYAIDSAGELWRIAPKEEVQV